jgi:hypothetical protein
MVHGVVPPIRRGASSPASGFAATLHRKSKRLTVHFPGIRRTIDRRLPEYVTGDCFDGRTIHGMERKSCPSSFKV